MDISRATSLLDQGLIAANQDERVTLSPLFSERYVRRFEADNMLLSASLNSADELAIHAEPISNSLTTAPISLSLKAPYGVPDVAQAIIELRSSFVSTCND